jgi:hypothetical protein
VIYHYYPSEASEGSHYQLYNLANDPFEQNNLATSNPGQLRTMMKDLIAGLEKQNAISARNRRQNAAKTRPAVSNNQ